MLPFIIFFYLTDLFGDVGKLVALILFALAAFTDFLDGYIARKYNLVTDFGKFLDPIADKILATTGVLLLTMGANPIIPAPYGLIFVVIMLVRDYAITGLRQMAQLKGQIIAADNMARIKSAFLDITLLFGFVMSYILEYINKRGMIVGRGIEITTTVLYVFVGITAVLIAYTGVAYMVRNRVVLVDTNPENTSKDTNKKDKVN